MPFFAYPAEIRKVIYTTNAIESLNMSLRKVIKTRGSFPTDGGGAEAAVSWRWNTSPRSGPCRCRDWKAALQRFAILLGDRVPKTRLA